MPQDWIRITDATPRDGLPILLAVAEGGRVLDCDVCYWHAPSAEWRATHTGIVFGPATHYAPMPQRLPPEAG